MSARKISLSCEKCMSRNYHIPKSSQERLVLKKYCKKCEAHIIHKEEK